MRALREGKYKPARFLVIAEITKLCAKKKIRKNGSAKSILIIVTFWSETGQ